MYLCRVGHELIRSHRGNEKNEALFPARNELIDGFLPVVEEQLLAALGPSHLVGADQEIIHSRPNNPLLAKNKYEAKH